MMIQTVAAIEPIKGRGGRPRKRRAKLHADKAYDSKPLREEWRRRGITPRIARRGIESSERPGRHRWVVERTLSWLNRYRRLRSRYERRADMHLSLLHIGGALIC
jgi:IS5 family transposase